MLDLIWTERPLGRTTTEREDIQAKMADWAPKVAGRAEETDNLGYLPAATVSEIKSLGLAQIIQPKRYGGAAAPLITMTDVMIPTAAASGSTAWALAQYIMHNFMIARFPQACQDRIWGDMPDALVSGILIPGLGKAERAQGGYILSGRWPLVTGVDTSEWVMLSAFAPGADGSKTAHYFMVPTADVTILPTWTSLGLRGSASNDVEVKEIFVPDFMVSSDDHMKGQPHPGLEMHEEAMYRLPVYMCFGNLMTSAVIGIVESMLSAYMERDRQGLRSMTRQDAPDQAVNNLKVGEIFASLRAAEGLLARNAEEIHDYADAATTPGESKRAGFRCDAAFAGKLAFEAAGLVWDLSGARGCYEPNPIGRAWRDLAVASRHMTQKWDLNSMEFGRSVRGLPLTNPSL